MNPETPQSPREQIEMRLTALLLDEVPAPEAAALRELLRHCAELAKLHDSLKQTIELVRAASHAEPASAQPPLQLSEERRQQLLAQFKTRPAGQKPGAPAKPLSDVSAFFGKRGGVFWKHRTMRTLAQVTAVAVVLVLLAMISMPNFVRSRNTSQRNAVINNLRQLDGAKQQWALENKKSPTDTPTLDDLKPYIKGSKLPPAVAGEKYILGRVQDDPVAVAKNGQKIQLPDTTITSSAAQAPPDTTFAMREQVGEPAVGREALKRRYGLEAGRESAQVIGAPARPLQASESTAPATPAPPSVASGPSNVHSLNVVGYVDASKVQPGSWTFLPDEAFRRRYGSDAKRTPEIASLPTRSLRAGEPIAEKAPAPPLAAGAVVAAAPEPAASAPTIEAAPPRTQIVLPSATEVASVNLGAEFSAAPQAGVGGGFGGGGAGGFQEGKKVGAPDSSAFAGNPEWVGALGKPESPHSSSNRFTSRFAYAAIPQGADAVGQFKFDLDLNRNPAVDPTTGLPIAVPESARTQAESDSGVATASEVPPVAGLPLLEVSRERSVVSATNAIVAGSYHGGAFQNTGKIEGAANAIEHKVPVLGDLPAAGRAFRSESPVPDKVVNEGVVASKQSATTRKTFYRIAPGFSGGGMGGGGAVGGQTSAGAPAPSQQVERLSDQKAALAFSGITPSPKAETSQRNREGAEVEAAGRIAPEVNAVSVDTDSFARAQEAAGKTLAMTAPAKSPIVLPAPSSPADAHGQASRADSKPRPGARDSSDSAAVLDQRIAQAQQQVEELRKGLSISEADAMGVQPGPLIEVETLRRLKGLRVEAQAQYAKDEKLLEQIKATPPQELKKVLPTVVQDSSLGEYVQQLNLAEQERSRLKKDLSDENPAVATVTKQIQDLDRKIADRSQGILKGLETRVAASKRYLDSIDADAKKVREIDIAKAEKSRPYYEAKQQLEEMVRFRSVLNAKLASEKIDAAIPKTTTVEIVDKAVPAQKKTGGFAGLFPGGYASTARVKVERDVADIRGLSVEQPNMQGYDPYFTQTEFEVIQSEPVLSNVVDRLKLDEAWADKSGGAKLKLSDAIAQLKRKLDLSPVKNTSLVEIRAKSDKPEEAARIANAVAEAYRNYRQDQRKQVTLDAIKVLEDNFTEKEKEIQVAQERVEALRKQLRISEVETAGAAPIGPITEEDRPVRRAAANAPIPQPEVQTSDNAFSTFSLNVSDVAFKLAAASLEKGQMPDPASVRSEEFINAFDYRDPEPPPGVPVAFAWERARYPFAHNRDLLRFSVKTAAAGRQAGRPLNLVLLLDNSGSMERADRVQIIREALRVLAAQLQPQDTVSAITFARTARLWVDGISGSKADEVFEQVGGLTPQGGTNLEEAMRLAYTTALRHYLAGGINRVVLLTDGAANLGNVDPDALKQSVETHRKQGIALDCFGIGWEGFNDDLLEVLSRNGDGRYGFINSPEEAADEFAGQLAGALKVAASDVKVQVEFNPARVTAYRQIGYAKHQLTKEQFRDNTVDAAEIAAQEAGNALYTVEVNPAGAGPLCIVRCRFKIPGTTDYREHAWEVPFTGNAVSLDQASPAMRLAATASAFSEWLVASPFAAEVTPDRLLAYLSRVPEVYGADARPKKLEWMIRQAKSIEGK